MATAPVPSPAERATERARQSIDKNPASTEGYNALAFALAAFAAPLFREGQKWV